MDYIRIPGVSRAHDGLRTRCRIGQRVLGLLLGLTTILVLTSVAASDNDRKTIATWDTALEAQPGQATYHNDVDFGGFNGQPLAVTDFNGDQIPDVVLCPFSAARGFNQLGAGRLNIFLGDGTVTGIRSIDGELGRRVRILGIPESFLGGSIATGDVNDDGIDDLLVGALQAGRFRGTGRVYLILGRPDPPDTIDLAAPPDGVTTVLGRDTLDVLGVRVHIADVDGDQAADLVLGAPGGDGPDNRGPTDVGEAVVIFNSGDFPTVIDLADPPAALRITTIYGLDAGDGFGGSIVAADFNRDGADELAIGTRFLFTTITPGDGPDNQREDAGEVQVVKGGELPRSLELSSALPEGTTTFFGPNESAGFGEDLVVGVRLIGHGPTLVVGSLSGTPPTAWMIPARVAVSGKAIDLAESHPRIRKIVRITDSPSLFSDSLVVGDFDGDGWGDVAIGDPLATPSETRPFAGSAEVVFGSRVWPSAVVLRDFSSGVRIFPRRTRYIRILGARADDMLAYSLAAGDVDMDGQDDIAPNIMGGDGVDEANPESGGAYVISGRELASRIRQAKKQAGN